MIKIETLKRGSHSSPEDGMCLMEAASYLAGEKFSDHPQCVSPLLGMFGRAINDRMPDDATRALLLPLVPLLLNTAGDGRDQRRGLLCADWAVRTAAPRALDVAGMTEHAATLRALPEVIDKETALAARTVCVAAYAAAYAADAAAAAAAAAAASDAADAAAAAAASDAAARAADAYAAAAAYAAADAAADVTCAADLPWPEVVEFFGRLIEGE